MTANALILTILVMAPLALLRAETVIARNGQPAAVIVIAEKPPRLLKLAAEELQASIEKISGARLAITSTPADGMHIFVGRSPHTDALKMTDKGLEHGAFRIVSSPGAIVLIGHDADFTPPEPHAYRDILRKAKDAASEDGK